MVKPGSPTDFKHLRPENFQTAVLDHDDGALTLMTVLPDEVVRSGTDDIMLPKVRMRKLIPANDRT